LLDAITAIDCTAERQTFLNYALQNKQTADSNFENATAAVEHFRFQLPAVPFNQLYPESPSHVSECSKLWSEDVEDQMAAYNQTLDNIKIAAGRKEQAEQDYQVELTLSQVL
jgi:hypothetical protein